MKKKQKSVVFIFKARNLFFTFFLSLVMLNIQLSAQEQRISIKLRNVSLEKVLQEINQKTGLNYLYNNDKINIEFKVSISARNKTVVEILDQCLKESQLRYKIKEKTIILIPKEVSSDPESLKQTLKGTVSDKESGMVLFGANVIVLNTSPLIGGVTNEYGEFKFANVPVGRYSLQVSYLGYEDVVVPEIMIGSAKEVVLDIKLHESLLAVGEVEVKTEKGVALNQMTTVSARSFSVEETQRYAASISDPGRMALSFAGVATGDDLLNEIIIRGNSPDKMLWRIEGIEVPSPNHFTDEGMSAGAISMLSANIVGKSDFLTGAFPAEYGNALSGVFDIRLRDGNSEKREYAFQAGFFGTDISAEGPFAKNFKGSYLFNYRYSTLGLFDLMGFKLAGEIFPNYQDISFKLNLPTGKTGNISIWGIGGNTVFKKKEVERDSTKWENMDDRYEDESMDYMMASGITHTFFPWKDAYWKTTLAYTANGYYYHWDTLNNNYEPIPSYHVDMANSSFRFASYFNKKVNKRLTIRTGFNYSLLECSYESEGYDDVNIWRVFLKSTDQTLLYQGYVQTKYRLSENISLNTGINYQSFDINKQSSLEPRLGVSWRFNPNQTIGIGYGKHSRHDPLPVYFKRYLQSDSTYVLKNRELKLPTADHYIISYNNSFSQNLKLKLELYYQGLSNYTIAKDSAYTISAAEHSDNFEQELASIGLGRNYGIEFTLEKYFTQNYYFLITTSLFKSEFRAANQRWYSTGYDLRYITNFVGGKEFKIGKRDVNFLGLNSKIIWAGGRPDTPINEQASRDADYTFYYQNQRNTIRLKAYFRLDIGISYRINNPKVSHILSLDIQNVTNRLNIAKKEFDSDENKVVVLHQAGIIPIFNYRLEF